MKKSVNYLLVVLALAVVVVAAFFVVPTLAGSNLKGMLPSISQYDVTVRTSNGAYAINHLETKIKTNILVKLSKAYKVPVTVKLHLTGTAKVKSPSDNSIGEGDYSIGQAYSTDGTGGAYLDVIVPRGKKDAKVYLQFINDSKYENVETISAKAESASYPATTAQAVPLRVDAIPAVISIKDEEDKPVDPVIINVSPANGATVSSDESETFKISRVDTGWELDTTNLCFLTPTAYCTLPSEETTNSFVMTPAEWEKLMNAAYEEPYQSSYTLRWYVQSGYWVNSEHLHFLPFNSTPTTITLNVSQSEEMDLTLIKNSQSPSGHRSVSSNDEMAIYNLSALSDEKEVGSFWIRLVSGTKSLEKPADLTDMAAINDFYNLYIRDDGNDIPVTITQVEWDESSNYNAINLRATIDEDFIADTDRDALSIVLNTANALNEMAGRDDMLQACFVNFSDRNSQIYDTKFFDIEESNPPYNQIMTYANVLRY